VILYIIIIIYYRINARYVNQGIYDYRAYSKIITY